MIQLKINNFNRMKIEQLTQLLETVMQQPTKKMVVVNAIDHHSVEAAQKAVELKLVKATLTGDRSQIEKICDELTIDSGLFEIIHTDSEDEAAITAVKMVTEKKADFMMKGLISTDKYIRALLNKEFGMLPPKGVLSHVTVIENPNYHKLLIVSDVAVIPYPDLNQKIVLCKYLIQTARVLGIEKPKLALIAPTEQVLPSITACSEAALIAKMADRGQIKDADIDGPMALDVAIDNESAKIKKITSSVAGDADCLLFPNIDAGNVFYKMNTKLCKAEQAAVVVGAKVPAILSSRGDSTQTKLNSIALAALLTK